MLQNFKNKYIIFVGLIGAIFMYLSIFFNFIEISHIITLPMIISIFLSSFFSIAFIFFIYFIGIVLRKKGKNINLELIQKLLIFFCFFYAFLYIIDIIRTFFMTIYSINLFIMPMIRFSYFIVLGFYLLNIFMGKGISINNNIYLLFSLMLIILELQSNLFSGIGFLLVTTYFYNYYNLLKERD